jgi:predicted transcriptional regulator
MNEREKARRTFYLEQETAEKIERLARETRRSLSAIVEMAVDDLAKKFNGKGKAQ